MKHCFLHLFSKTNKCRTVSTWWNIIIYTLKISVSPFQLEEDGCGESELSWTIESPIPGECCKWASGHGLVCDWSACQRLLQWPSIVTSSCSSDLYRQKTEQRHHKVVIATPSLGGHVLSPVEILKEYQLEVVRCIHLEMTHYCH